jgi:hypothetical protein
MLAVPRALLRPRHRSCVQGIGANILALGLAGFMAAQHGHAKALGAERQGQTAPDTAASANQDFIALHRVIVGRPQLRRSAKALNALPTAPTRK